MIRLGSWDVEFTGSRGYFGDDDWRWDGGYRIHGRFEFGATELRVEMGAHRDRKTRKVLTAPQCTIAYEGCLPSRTVNLRHSLLLKKPWRHKWPSLRALLRWLEESLEPELRDFWFGEFLRDLYSPGKATCVYQKQGDQYQPFATMYRVRDSVFNRLPVGEYYMIDVNSGREWFMSRSHHGTVSGGVREFLPLLRWEGLRHGWEFANRRH